MAWDISGAQDAVNKGFAQGQQNRFNTLAGQAFSAPPEQRQQYLSQAAMLNPAGAMQYGQALQGNDDDKHKKLAQMAVFMLNVPEGPMREQAYQRVRPDLERLGIGPVPPTMDDQVKGLLGSLEKAWGGAGEGAPHVQSRFVNQNGDVIAMMSDGSMVRTGETADPRTQLRDQPGLPPGLVTMSGGQRGAIAPLSEGGQPAKAGGISIDPSMFEGLDQQSQQALLQRIMADAQGQAQPETGGFSASPSGLAAARPQTTPTQEAAIELSRAANARAEARERRAVEANDEKPKRSPLPVGAMKMILENQEGLSIAGSLDATLAKFETQIMDGSLDLGLLMNPYSAARNYVGQSNPNSRNYNSFMAGLEKMRNDSLRLNSGVQTEGDAQRAWNELVANINDEGAVLQRLGEIRLINAQAIRLRNANIDAVKANYEGAGAAPEARGAADLSDDELLRELGLK